MVACLWTAGCIVGLDEVWLKVYVETRSAFKGIDVALLPTFLTLITEDTMDDFATFFHASHWPVANFPWNGILNLLDIQYLAG